MCSLQSVHRASTNVHRGGIELVEETNGMVAAVTGEVAVVAVDHGQARTQREVAPRPPGVQSPGRCSPRRAARRQKHQPEECDDLCAPSEAKFPRRSIRLAWPRPANPSLLVSHVEERSAREGVYYFDNRQVANHRPGGSRDEFSRARGLRVRGGVSVADRDPRTEEAGVLEAIRAGDASAFAIIAERYKPQLHVHCYRMLGSVEDAEDLVQGTLLRAWRGRAGFEGRSLFRTWLYRIATNACLNKLERTPRRVLPQDVAPR
jgi:Sigma-70 region 2